MLLESTQCFQSVFHIILCERRCVFSTSVRSSLRACAASLLSSFSPFLSTASITWRRSGSHTTALLPCCRSCGEHKHRNKDRCTCKNAECTGEVINKHSVKRGKKRRGRGTKNKETHNHNASRIKATIKILMLLLA